MVDVVVVEDSVSVTTAALVSSAFSAALRFLSPPLYARSVPSFLSLRPFGPLPTGGAAAAAAAGAAGAAGAAAGAAANVATAAVAYAAVVADDDEVCFATVVAASDGDQLIADTADVVGLDLA